MNNNSETFCNEICRTCGVQCNCQMAEECFSMMSLFYEFDISGRTVAYSYLLQYCTNIQVKENDKLPKTICGICAEKLKMFYEFKLLCEKTNQEIESAFYPQNHNYSSSFKSYCNGVNDVNSVVVKIEKESTDDDEDNNNQQQVRVQHFRHKRTISNGLAEISLKCNYCQMMFYSCKDFQNHSPRKCSSNMKQDVRQSQMDLLNSDYDMASEYAEVNYGLPIDNNGNEDNAFVNIMMSNHEYSEKDESAGGIAADFLCFLCEKKLNSLTNLRKHAKSHQRLHNFHCRRCDLQFMSKNILMLHYRKVHKIVDAQINKIEPNESFCFVCRKKFPKRYYFLKHVQSHKDAEEMPYKCSYCLKSFESFDDFDYHEKNHERNNHERLKCAFCGLIFPTKLQFNPHFERHFINDRLYEKPRKPSLMITSSSDYSNQMEHDTESFRCLYCSKIMANKTNMMNHLKSKHGEDENLAKFI